MKKLLIVFFLLVVIFAGAIFWWRQGVQAANPQDKTTKIFVIRNGEGIRAISNDLKKQGLIKDPTVFFLLVKKMGLDGKIQAGDFRLSPSMTAAQIAQELIHGTLDIWVTIPEGKRGGEIADILKEKMPGYKDSWKTVLEHNEGYLFPDTYLIPRDAPIDTIASLMRNTFEKKYQQLKPGKNSNLSKETIVIVASMVSREAKFKEDQPLVASVILNRLQLGMPLQIDATVQYALGYEQNEKTWWKKSLSPSDVKLDSAYNSYTNTGLPPGPIANPGTDTLQAVIDAPNTDYLYYISDKDGHNHYAKTNTEHNENIKKYGL